MMDTVFVMVLNTALASSWILAAVMLIRIVFRKMPKRYLVVLWCLAGMRLLMPYVPEAGWSAVPAARILPQETLQGPLLTVETGTASMDAALNGYFGSHYFEGVSVPAGMLENVMRAAGWIWFVTAVLLLGRGLLQALRLRRKLRHGGRMDGDTVISEDIRTPFVFGVFRPAICLPAGLPEDEKAYVLLHERAHIRRHDPLWRMAGWILLCVYWFHPLVQIGVRMFAADTEMACDESVIKDLSFADRRQYASVLLAQSTGGHPYCPPAFGKNAVRSRIAHILSFRRPVFWRSAAALAAVGLTAALFLTARPHQSSDVSIAVPAGAGEGIYLSDDVFLADADRVEIYPVSGTGDAEVFLTAEDGTPSAETVLSDGRASVLTAEKGGLFRIGVQASNSTQETLYIRLRLTPVKVQADRRLVRTDYVGNASASSAAAQQLPLPSGAVYDHIAIQSDRKPYGLTVYVRCSAALQEEAFRSSAEQAFRQIGNLGVIRFEDAAAEDNAVQFVRGDLLP